jgi:hypothetical protein
VQAQRAERAEVAAREGGHAGADGVEVGREVVAGVGRGVAGGVAAVPFRFHRPSFRWRSLP